MEKNFDKTKISIKKGEENLTVTEEKKLSYEELEQIANQLSYRCQQLSERLQKQNMEITFRRLDYLFAVVNNTTNCFSPEFTESCANEIVDIMTVKEEEEE